MVIRNLIIGGKLFTITMQVENGGEYKAEIVGEDSIKAVELRVIYWDALSHHLIFELYNKRYEARLLLSPEKTSSIYFFQSKKEFVIEYQGKKNNAMHTIAPAVALTSRHELPLRALQVLKSPLGGRVVKVLVQSGDMVVVNQPLVIIESMKMENELCSPYDAIVKNLSIVQGNLVQSNQVLITFEKKGDGDAASKSKYEQKEVQNR